MRQDVHAGHGIRTCGCSSSPSNARQRWRTRRAETPDAPSQPVLRPAPALPSIEEAPERRQRRNGPPAPRRRDTYPIPGGAVLGRRRGPTGHAARDGPSRRRAAVDTRGQGAHQAQGAGDRRDTAAQGRRWRVRGAVAGEEARRLRRHRPEGDDERPRRSGQLLRAAQRARRAARQGHPQEHEETRRRAQDATLRNEAEDRPAQEARPVPAPEEEGRRARAEHPVTSGHRPPLDTVRTALRERRCAKRHHRRRGHEVRHPRGRQPRRLGRRLPARAALRHGEPPAGGPRPRPRTLRLLRRA